MAAFALLIAPCVRAGGRIRPVPQPAYIAQVSRHVFGPRWRVAACIAHRESTDGAFLVNGSMLGPWQIDASAHAWVNRWRLVNDWVYSARAAYRISDGGRDWSAWTVHGLCGV